MTGGGLFWAKLLFAVVVAGVGLSGTTLPWVLRGRSKSERVLALSDTFAGGVLGGAGLLHLLAGGIDDFRADLPGLAYPLALLLAGIGFLLILLIEGVVVGGAGHHGPVEDRPLPAVQHETAWHGAGEGAASYPLVLLVVLSVHSVILGLALGAQTAFAGAVVVFVAIVAHKGAAGFALGVGYERAGFTPRRAFPQVAVFSSMTPIGIALGAGIGVALTGHAALLFEAVFDSLGAGTFIYIGALDIIKTEFDSPEDHGLKWLAAAVGFGIMAVVAIWV